jgi:hypothetical protein
MAVIIAMMIAAMTVVAGNHRNLAGPASAGPAVPHRDKILPSMTSPRSPLFPELV